MLGNRIVPALAALLDSNAAVDDAFADRFDPLGLQQEMIVDEVHRALPSLLQMLEFCHHVRGAARTPFARVEDRDVAEDARPRASARGLHRGETFLRERTAGTSNGIDSMKSRGRLSRSGNGHWSRSRSATRFGLFTTLPSRAQVSPATATGTWIRRRAVRSDGEGRRLAERRLPCRYSAAGWGEWSGQSLASDGWVREPW
jgi:hypothetical protein